jgi:Concanavalin A-like lectin/glucanases superfamily
MKQIFTILVPLICLLYLDCRAQPGEVPNWRLDYFGPQGAEQAPNPIRDSLVAYYGMEESSGTRYDGHGTNHLSAYNSPGDTVGVIGRAAKFDNVQSQYLQSASTQLSTMGESFSLMFWARRYAPLAGESQVLIHRGTSISGGANLEYAFFGVFGGYQTRLEHSSGTLILSIGNTSTAWNLYSIIFDRQNDSLTLYINCVQVDKDYVSGDVNTIGPWTVGANGSGASTFLGSTDEMYIWRGVTISCELMNWYYNSGAGRSYDAMMVYSD